MKHFVMDCSVAMTWCFEDEKTRHSEAILESLMSGAQAAVPALWAYEVLNVLAIAEKKKRITHAHSLHFWKDLRSFQIRTDEDGTGNSFLEILALTERYRLTAYDAAYLELAIRRRLPLATFDDELRKAAKSTGVGILHGL